MRKRIEAEEAEKRRATHQKNKKSEVGGNSADTEI